ncbi:FecR family protein [Chitinophaga arvensicola]|uniref:FecR protein n=1 Tax=Chitinophaga arvensicola TaxID=29529 RepID=A0A1I0PYG0_9BACT|nr:FecR family protein [Chitinophaga arvensicola]SEW19601.1 protein of unknown function [Chitinophaga arvensicola]
MERISYLLQQYLSDNASIEEIQELLQWLRDNPDNAPLLQQALETSPVSGPAANKDRMWNVISAATRPRKIHPMWKVAAAAVLAGGIYAGIGYWHHPAVKQPLLSQQIITPGTNGAILTLDDGSNITIDSSTNGTLVIQKGVTAQLHQQRLEYTTDHVDALSKTAYNTVTTPKGRQFQLQLPDGSMVWLNAASSIRFPTHFSENNRTVTVTGEAYFKITPDAEKPFFVNTTEMDIAVLGTEFNINAYADEPAVKATLISGRITAGTKQQPAIHLSPGEQVSLAPGTPLKIARDINIEQVTAWVNGGFNFENMSLREVMRQLARWYDLEIIYEKNVPDIAFGGEISRHVPLQDLLAGLKDMGIHFRIEAGRKLIVSP